MASITRQQFDDIYWASLPPAIQALRNMSDDQNQRTQAAGVLVSEGYTIDVAVQVWNWDPYTEMASRLSYGYTWIPAAGQPNIPVAPGDVVPGQASYNPLAPPPGSIKVSINPADYPPYAVPAPPPAPAAHLTLVGPVYNDGNPNDHIALMPASSQYRGGQTITVDYNGSPTTFEFVYPSIFSQPIWRQTQSPTGATTA